MAGGVAEHRNGERDVDDAPVLGEALRFTRLEGFAAFEPRH
jgi:hypothetical protein